MNKEYFTVETIKGRLIGLTNFNNNIMTKLFYLLLSAILVALLIVALYMQDVTLALFGAVIATQVACTMFLEQKL